MRPATRSIAALPLMALAACSASDSTAPAAPSASAVAPAAITRIDLGTLGGSLSMATDINNAGTVVGWSTTAQGTNRAFRWTPKGGMVALPLPPGYQWSRAAGISPLGKIIGVGDSAGGQGRPVAWSATGAAIAPPVPMPAGAVILDPVAMNDLNQLAGYSYDDYTYPRAWFWSKVLGFTDITSTIPGAHESYATDLNSWGLVMGTNTDCTGGGCNPRAFTWHWLTGNYNIGIPSGADNSTTEVGGISVNELGQVAGWIFLFPSGYQGYRWVPGHGFTIFPPLAPFPYSYSYADDLNNRGMTVGASYDLVGDVIRATAWPTTGGIVALTPTEPYGSVAVAINDRDIVAGWAETAAGPRAVVWRLPAGLVGSTPSSAQRLEVTATAGLGPRRSRLAGCLDARGVTASKVAVMGCMAQLGKTTD